MLESGWHAVLYLSTDTRFEHDSDMCTKLVSHSSVDFSVTAALVLVNWFLLCPRCLGAPLPCSRCAAGRVLAPGRLQEASQSMSPAADSVRSVTPEVWSKHCFPAKVET